MKNRFKSTLWWILISLFSFYFSSSSADAHSYNLSKVVIDAGHGGHDAGCLGTNTKEKDVALGVALKLGNLIEEHFPDVHVVYTRKTDVFVELHQRAEIANNAKADLFICVHCNSACYRDKKKKKDVCSEETYGVETWVMGLHVAGANLEVAKRENEVVVMEKDYVKKYDGFDPNSAEANIIFSLYQNTFLDQSLRFASLVEDEISKKGREVRGVKQAGFLVLYKTYMPSVLVETGFLTNSKEEAFLSSEKGQETIAKSIFNAFSTYKKSVEKSNEDKPANTSASNHNSETVTQDTQPDKKPMKVKSDSLLVPKKRPAKTGPDSVGAEIPINDPGKQYETKRKEVADTSAGPVYEFAVQIFLSQRWVSPTDKRFNGLSDIHDEIDNGIFKYTVGNYKNFKDAVAEQKKLRQQGFSDAFIVAYKNGKRIPTPQALKEAK